MGRGNVVMERRWAELGTPHPITVSWGIVQADLVSLMPFQSHLLSLCLGEASSFKQHKKSGKKICLETAQLADS